jgi:murein DD-endopeptidase MepM/ murein hydrolase activator NlpD
MRGPVYRYNTVTCRYERMPVSATKISSYVLGLGFCAAAMLAGLLLLHDFLVDTPAELAYRKENNTLEKYQVILAKQLEEADEKLSALQKKDEKLHDKFFATLPTIQSAEANPDHSKQKILLADAWSFREVVKDLKKNSDDLIGQSIHSNMLFADKQMHTDFNNNLIPGLPLYQPLGELTPEKLVSGFGTRINPFHKGLYHHLGIDIAVPRGTDVLATAQGQVSTAKYSDIQAGFGNYVEIDHGNGFITRYAHLEDIKVRVGQKVGSGFIIATTGSSGGSVAPHLHYEIIRHGRNVDPVMYMITGVSTDMHEQFRTVSQKENQSLD